MTQLLHFMDLLYNDGEFHLFAFACGKLSHSYLSGEIVDLSIEAGESVPGLDAKEGRVGVVILPEADIVEVGVLDGNALFACAGLDGNRLCGVLEEDGVIVEKLMLQVETLAAGELIGLCFARKEAGGGEQEKLG